MRTALPVLEQTTEEPRRSADGRTPVHDAALDDDTDALLALLAAGADADAADDDGAVALHCATHTGALGAVRVLLAAQRHP